MKIAILGAGFSGLTAAYHLAKKGHSVIVFEKEASLGGLAVGFKNPKWNWSLEKAYHHWFTNDKAVLDLAHEINQQVIVTRPITDVFIKGKQLPFDSIKALITFPYLSFFDRLRVGSAVLYLKLTSNYKKFEGEKAYPWIQRWMGQKATKLIWEPLLSGKFGTHAKEIALTWFWARIKKRTQKLAYPKGGFQVFANKLGSKVKKMGGKIYLNSTVLKIKSADNKCIVETKNKKEFFDKVIVTLPSPVFVKMAERLPKKYMRQITSIPHLHAQVLVLLLKKPFMKKAYWLNITDKNFPFLVLAEHTNFMDPKHYNNQHILYIGNYLPPNHPYLKKTAQQLLKEFDPYLVKINPNYKLQTINYQLFTGPFAQPVVTTKYPELIPTFKTPFKNIYLANLDMVYPWDRGTNYAVELGEKVARIIATD